MATTTMRQALLRTDWRLLARQKAWLAQAAEHSQEAAGLLHFLDAVQDAAVDDLGLAEQTVFPDLPPG